MRLLLVEDSLRLRDLLAERIHDAGWGVDWAPSISEALALTRAVTYDLALIDLGLPDGDGVSLVEALRAGQFVAPILVITARASIEDRVRALDHGADDYLIKPFNHIELMARCRALIRRSGVHVVTPIAAGRLSLDPASGAFRVGDIPLQMAPRERSLLELLLRNSDRVVAKAAIEMALSEIGEEISTNAVESAISRLRRRLQPADSRVTIETIRGVGYMLCEAAKDG